MKKIILLLASLILSSNVAYGEARPKIMRPKQMIRNMRDSRQDKKENRKEKREERKEKKESNS